MPMANPPHPGRSLLRDCIEELGLSIAEAAERLRIHDWYLEEVCRCEAPITPMIAIRIDQAFGGGAETWLAMQSAYDLWETRELLAVFKRLSESPDH